MIDNTGVYERLVSVAVLVTGLLWIILANSGCTSASPGRVTLGEWNSLSAEQMAAIATSDAVVYETASGKTSALEESKNVGADWWVDLAKIISGLRVRIRVICVEWGAAAEVHGGAG